jgi:hypothetical protein
MRPRRHADPLHHRGPSGAEAIVIVLVGGMAVVVALAGSVAFPLLASRP